MSHSKSVMLALLASILLSFLMTNTSFLVHATSSECGPGPCVYPGSVSVLHHHGRHTIQEEESLLSAESHEHSLTTTTTSETAAVRSSLSKQANDYISLSANKSCSSTGPTNLKLVNRQGFKGKDKTSCVACRLDCLGTGSVFSKCKSRYFYYGCRKKNPCYDPLTATRTVIETAIGICIDKNGCILKPTGIKKGKALLNKVIKKIRKAADLDEDNDA
ncbi:hypothetical protein C9374_011957 [Naegleria lovaniensis]|uniref:Uncharacterized protein n=1 Tax=Naegleria lovaniensis TaxID=51637 RepID=A0AA88KCX4_NAELO|nr:uncharacterized protein C9374_011957 [Naegleria lovaniensis]KAG2373668.1 hypothetical protein C9374_011957 [Naegleria lovaniensis]